MRANAPVPMETSAADSGGENPNAPVTPFSVYEGGSVILTRAGDIGYPGVMVRAGRGGAAPRQTVRVTLPRDKGLRFVAEGNPGYRLTVENGDQYNGTLSADGQLLTFENVGLPLPEQGSTSLIWVAVKASGSASRGDTRLSFRVGDATSPSSSITVAGPRTG